MAFNLGVNVLETDGRASATLQTAPTSVAAFLGPTERGEAHQPTRVTSPAQFRERFGGPLSDGYLSLAIDGFFLNGGREAIVSRVVGPGSVAASLSLSNRASTAGPALRVLAGYRGRPDPGPWGHRLRIDVRDDPRAKTTLQANTVANATSAVVGSLNGIRVGGVVGFAVSGAATQYRKITNLDPTSRTIQWDAGSPITAVLAVATTTVATAEFRLVVRSRASATSEFIVIEEWPNLSMERDSADYAVDRVNHPFTGSRAIRLDDLSGSAASGVENPAIVSGQPLSGGIAAGPTGADYRGDPALRTGLWAFELSQVQLLAVPDAQTLVDSTERKSVIRDALDYCARRGDCMFIGSAPDRAASSSPARVPADYTQTENDYLGSIKTYAADFQAAKVFGALYAPWIQVNDPTGSGPASMRFIPPDGHVMGIFARTEQERGLVKAPAGNAAVVRGALDLAADFDDAQATDLTRSALVNGIRVQSGTGLVVTASRTLSSDPRWWFVNVRLIFNFVKSTLRDGLRFVRQEPHTEELRRKVKFNVVTPFLLGLWRQGAFGSDPPAQAFTVKCDIENNPPEEVDLGNFKLEVYFYPTKPVETVVVVVGQQPSGATARET